MKRPRSSLDAAGLVVSETDTTDSIRASVVVELVPSSDASVICQLLTFRRWGRSQGSARPAGEADSKSVSVNPKSVRRVEMSTGAPPAPHYRALASIGAFVLRHRPRRRSKCKHCVGKN